MNNNVIDSQFAIECGHDGTLEIIGEFQCSVVFRMSGHLVDDLRYGPCGLPSYCKNPIFTLDINSRKDIFIFEKSLGGELRNPQKLLKAVRNKLMQISYRNSANAEARFNAMYEPTDRQVHEMFQEDRGDRLEPLPQAYYF